MSPFAQKAMHTIQTLWQGLGRVPDLTQSSIATATALTAVWFALLLFFYSVPGLDLALAGLFFRAQECGASLSHAVCGSFPISHNRLVQIVRKLLFYLPHVTGVVVVVTLIVKIVESKDRRVSAFPVLKKHNSDWIAKLSLSLLTALIGPFFIVNVILKEWSGRPRPIETNLFGGPFNFAPAGSFSGACDGNCSFISGEAAGAGILICVVPLLPPVWRRRLGPPLVIASIATALLRVAFGGHYFSDAVLGWLSSPTIFAWVFALYHLRNRPQKR
ncbi:membrane-associated phospholipid phosphatase [Agrobacterium vitis]|nr:membrane-associated phospholipid phosphatase [Agrobacterium vitis]MBE1440152.1 membrane-associated phospholipid phosphatase [Agrobacterium vitis]